MYELKLVRLRLSAFEPYVDEVVILYVLRPVTQEPLHRYLSGLISTGGSIPATYNV